MKEQCAPLTISHAVPLVGPTDIPIYPPADTLYRFINRAGEVRRLNSLRHIGALSHALQGARQTRWDYTVAMLHYASCLKSQGAKTRFRIDQVEMSSLAAAVQCLSLAWNIGHLPGTFSVEKGVCRYLWETRKRKPAEFLDWPGYTEPAVKRIISHSNEILMEDGYLSLSRVLAVRKLLQLRTSVDDEIDNLNKHILAPFFLNYEEKNEQKWKQIGNAFLIVRHAAYLSVDYAIAGMHWAPDISPLVKELCAVRDYRVGEVSGRISELLSPVERETYARLYHSEAARRETAIVAHRTHQVLQSLRDPQETVDTWTRKSRFTQLKLGKFPERKTTQMSGTIRLRTLFSYSRKSPEEAELSMAKAGIELPLYSEYRAWNSDTLIEPDELLFDAFNPVDCSSTDIGNLLVWFIDDFEELKGEKQSKEVSLERVAHSRAYEGLIKRAVEIKYPGVSVRFEPWPLHRFEIFSDTSDIASRVAVWATSSTIDDSVAVKILRDRSKRILKKDRTRFAEVLGLAGLRGNLRRTWKARIPRQRCLLVTASVIFTNTKDGKDLIEYDGGVLTVSARGGKMRWYGLETKSRTRDPVASLTKRLRVLDIEAQIEQVRRAKVKCAYAGVDLF